MRSAHFGLALAAYVSVGLLLVGGMALLPWLVQALLRQLQPLAAGNALALLALERAAHARQRRRGRGRRGRGLSRRWR